MTITIDEKNFKDEVLGSETPTMVDFWAPWCGPCHIMEPIIEEVAKEYSGKVKVGKINVDENQVLSSQYGIMSIPTILIFKAGKIVGQIVGARPKSDLTEALNKTLAS